MAVAKEPHRHGDATSAYVKQAYVHAYAVAALAAEIEAARHLYT